jgi:hypothetical protein
MAMGSHPEDGQLSEPARTASDTPAGGGDRSDALKVIRDIVRDPRQRGILIAGILSLFTVGLLPRVLEPGLPDAQE